MAHLQLMSIRHATCCAHTQTANPKAYI